MDFFKWVSRFVIILPKKGPDIYLEKIETSSYYIHTSEF
jgi:hypothetical protein